MLLPFARNASMDGLISATFDIRQIPQSLSCGEFHIIGRRGAFIPKLRHFVPMISRANCIGFWRRNFIRIATPRGLSIYILSTAKVLGGLSLGKRGFSQTFLKALKVRVSSFHFQRTCFELGASSIT